MCVMIARSQLNWSPLSRWIRNVLFRQRVFFSLISFCLFLPSLLPSAEETIPQKYGGQLVISTVSDPKTFNDIMAKETSSTIVTSHIFDGLTTTNAFTTKVEPH